MRQRLYLILLVLVLPSIPLIAQSGKIAGFVHDARTGEPIVGANVIVEGTRVGAATDVNGYYVIVSVPPGQFAMRVTSLGYAPAVVIDVVVNIDLTTSIDVRLVEEAIQVGEITVVAERPVVRQDLSASTANIQIEEINRLPVATLSDAVALQPGVETSAEGGLVIRGGSADETAFVVDGLTLRDERDNKPFTVISLTSIEQVQVQTGGFNAEFGNIRSGVVNVVTKEGRTDSYHVGVLGRYRAAGPKYFGGSPNALDSYWIRPYVDDAVCWSGTTNGAWDDHTQKQFQPFRGWNKVSQELVSDSDPSNDLTPLAAQQVFLWQHRKEFDIEKPDYDVDMIIAGPVPVVAEVLGNLRFALSYRSSREMYFIPLSDDSYREYNYQLKLTSDIGTGMKLTLDGLMGKRMGTNSSRSGGPGIFRSSESIAPQLDLRASASYLDGRVFATDYWNPTRVSMKTLGAKFSHVLSSATYYDVSLSRVAFAYDSNPGRSRDTETLYQFGDAFYDEAPYGYRSGQSAGIGSSMNMGLGFSNSRDTSRLTTYTLRIDLATQYDQYHFFKVGAEFVYTDNDVNYALVEPSLNSFTHSKWHTYPVRGAVYVQDKLEFEGMVANVGIRLDYSHAGGQWYRYDPYNSAFSGEYAPGIDSLLQKEDTKRIVTLSPRLGVSFPISIDSKLYFNYGHFRSMPVPEDLYMLRTSQQQKNVTYIADPNKPLPLTVAYELGYEHNISDQVLVRLAGYYKDVSNQTRTVTYTSRDNSVNYSTPEPTNYADVRGFEVSISKSRGEWVQGFLNYTYSVQSNGFFGLSRYSENPALQRQFERDTRAFEQDKPVPTPYARANIDVFTPVDFGPALGGIGILADWRLSVLGSWESGRYFSWTGPGGSKPGYQNNIQWRDFVNIDIRLTKAFRFGPVRLELSMDVTNIMNHKYMDYRAGFATAEDYDAYMTSLHLPEGIEGVSGYTQVYGDDQPGDYRVGPYIPWDESAPDDTKEEWRKNKSYIDMPNLSYLTFLNPRAFFWGFRVSVDL